MSLHILGAQVTLSCKQHLNVLRGGIEDGRKIVGCHLRGFDVEKRKREQRCRASVELCTST